MPDTADRYALPLIQSGQAQKDVTYNDAMTRIDALLQLAVEGTRTVPPTAPATGECWIVGPAASGAWAGLDGRIAAFTSAGWLTIVPHEGCLAWLKDAGVFALFRSGGWQSEAWPVKALSIGGRTVLGVAAGVVAAPAGGTVIDVQARAVLEQVLSGLRSLGLFPAS